MRKKYSLANFVYFSTVLHAEICTTSDTEFAKFAGLYFSHFTTFCDSFAFTNFKMLFLAVVMDFVLLAYIKI